MRQCLHRAHNRRCMVEVEETGRYQTGVVVLMIDVETGKRRFCSWALSQHSASNHEMP
jgi:hypothetical protein